jgi:hypothetical protein
LGCVVSIIAATLPTSSTRAMPLTQMVTTATPPQVILIRGGKGRGFFRHFSTRQFMFSCRMQQDKKPDWCPPPNAEYETGGNCVVESGKVVGGSCLVLTGTDCIVKNGTPVGGQCFVVTPEQTTQLAVLALIIAFIGFFVFVGYRNGASEKHR